MEVAPSLSYFNVLVYLLRLPNVFLNIILNIGVAINSSYDIVILKPQTEK